MTEIQECSVFKTDFWSDFSSSKPNDFTDVNKNIFINNQSDIDSTIDIPFKKEAPKSIVNLALIPSDKVVKKSVHSYARASDRIQVLQKWEGTVLSIDHDENEFTARLFDKTTPNNPEEEVVISSDELSIGDICLLTEGAIFYWSIGYRYRGATKSKDSSIHFSRLKGFSTKDLKIANDKSKQLIELFSGIE